MIRIHTLLAGLLLGAVVGAGGCNRTLFSEADPYNQARLDRYWGGDSATRLSEERQKASEMGFGFPQGLANQ
jgi:hypothetical protein